MEKVLQNITKLYLVDVKYVQQKTADPRQKLLVVSNETRFYALPSIERCGVFSYKKLRKILWFAFLTTLSNKIV